MEVRLLLVVAAVAIIFDDLPPKVNLVMRYFVNSTTYSELVLECSDKKGVSPVQEQGSIYDWPVPVTVIF